ncbi:MAG: hypothetical protein ACI85U_001242 [Candidatus Promineifilaceae bacterium]|jgi:hypothetical protein
MCVCANVVYFRSDAALGVVARLWGDSTEEVLSELAGNQSDPAFNWTIISERSAPIGANSGSTDGVPNPVIIVEEVDLVRIKVQNQTGEIDVQAAGVSRSAEIIDDTGQSSYVFEYNEADLNEVMLTTVTSEMPPQLREQVILERVELKPGALVIKGQVNPSVGGWQSLGIISTVGSDGKSLKIVGIDIGGSVLDASAVGPMQELFGSVEQEINATLQAFFVISGNGVEVPLNQIYLGDGVLQVVFEN